MPAACSEHAQSNAPLLSSPSPSSPSPTPEEEEALPSGDGIPFESIRKAYHEILPELPECRSIPRDAIRARWEEDKERQCLDWWRDFFENDVKVSDYLMGKVKDWRASLSWLTAKEDMTKVLNGEYAANSKAADDNNLKNKMLELHGKEAVA